LARTIILFDALDGVIDADNPVSECEVELVET